MTDLLILAIVGAREAENYNLIDYYIRDYISRAGRIPDKIISGGAAGVDAMAYRFSTENNIPFQEFPARWQDYGRAAGPIRNRQIVEAATHVLAFPSQNSVGTRNTIDIAQKMSKPVTVVEL